MAIKRTERQILEQALEKTQTTLLMLEVERDKYDEKIEDLKCLEISLKNSMKFLEVKV